jgi:hypothetical protein
MNHKLIIVSIITAMVFLFIFSYFLFFEYNTFNIPNHSFLRIKELKNPGAIDKYIDWEIKREKPERESYMLYGLDALIPLFVLILFSEDLLIRSNKTYSILINKKLNIVSLINVVFIFILYYATLYFNDYFRLYIKMIPSLIFPIDILILCIFIIKKIRE